MDKRYQQHVIDEMSRQAGRLEKLRDAEPKVVWEAILRARAVVTSVIATSLSEALND